MALVRERTRWDRPRWKSEELPRQAEQRREFTNSSRNRGKEGEIKKRVAAVDYRGSRVCMDHLIGA